MSEEAKRVGEEIGTQVEAVVGSVEGTSAAAIEEAKRKADEANKTAEAIAAASMQTALGERISKHEEELTRWREENEQRNSRLSALEQSQSQTNSLLSGISSTLEKLTQPPVKAVEEVITAPPETKTGASERKEDQKPQGRRRLFL